MARINPDKLHDAFTFLEEVMRSEGIPRHDLVICGGAAMLAGHYNTRTTRDVDIIAQLDPNKQLTDPRPLSPEMKRAAEAVKMELNLPQNWLNTEPAAQLEAGAGLPEGFKDRLVSQEYGPLLGIHYAGRIDLIFLKLHAAVDHSPAPNKHFQDLQALQPTAAELLEAARWVLGQDIGEPFSEMVRTCLTELGHPDVARDI